MSNYLGEATHWKNLELRAGNSMHFVAIKNVV
jgi:hypothetical protein